jgi:hypothetical protein
MPLNRVIDVKSEVYPMPPAIPNYDLGMLTTFNIGITFLSIFVAVVGIVIIVRQANSNTEYLTENSRKIAEIAERIDARLRRDFPDIGEDLQ